MTTGTLKNSGWRSEGTVIQGAQPSETVARQRRGTARIEVNGKSIDLMDGREEYEGAAVYQWVCDYCRTFQTDDARCCNCGAPHVGG